MVAVDMALETGIVEHHRVRVKQWLVATAAIRRLAQIAAADPVGGVAMGANNVK